MKVHWDFFFFFIITYYLQQDDSQQKKKNSTRCSWFESPFITYHKTIVCKALFEVCDGVYISLINLLGT